MIPTPAEWMQLLLGVTLIVVGFVVLRDRDE